MRRLLLGAFVLGAVVCGPLHAVNKYVAIGDSITAGTSWPVSCAICPAIFDCTGSCDDKPQADRDRCGFVRRLDTWLGGDAANYVKNRGWGGEQTAEAVLRFPTEMDTECPGSPGDCIAVVLMHGTNDMDDTVSPESARANLQLIVDEAKSRNLEVLLMTIIRSGVNPNNTKWEDYKDEILDLAADESLQSVNPWLTLCPNTSCYEDNYWWPGEGPCFDPDATPDPGHLDPDGYDELTDLIKAVFPGAVPALPLPTSPTGDLADTTPDFVWPEVATARWYELEVDGMTTWWEAAAHCSLGICTVDPGGVLVEGAHSWRVRGRNLRGMGGWSAGTDFEIWPVPGTPVGSAPTGAFDDVDPLNPPFGWEPYTWSEAVGATHYDLEVLDGGTPVLQQSFDSSICSASTCTAAPGAGLPEASYTWTVLGRNPGASGLPSAPAAFDIDHLPPLAPTAIAPMGDYFAHAPVYQWLAGEGATRYDIEVLDMANNVDAQASDLLASAVCEGGFCSHQEGTVLSEPDVYRFRARSKSDGGDGPFSAATQFTILTCDDASPKDLADFLTSGAVGTATEQHCGPLTGAATASFEIEATGDLTLHTGGGFAARDGFTVNGLFQVRSP